MARIIKETLTDGITLEEHPKQELKIRGVAGRRSGKHKFVREEVDGDDYHHDSGKWNLLHRVIDRVNDSYEKIIRDKETGKIVHQCIESLSGHRGHGSGKITRKVPQKRG